MRESGVGGFVGARSPSTRSCNASSLGRSSPASLKFSLKKLKKSKAGTGALRAREPSQIIYGSFEKYRRGFRDPLLALLGAGRWAPLPLRPLPALSLTAFFKIRLAGSPLPVPLSFRFLPKTLNNIPKNELNLNNLLTIE